MHVIMFLNSACYTQLQYISAMHDHAVGEETHACGAQILLSRHAVTTYIHKDSTCTTINWGERERAPH